MIDLEKLEDSASLLDTLIQVEAVLDSLDCYCYKSWFDGEVVEGPIVSRYWVKISLLYPYDKMPDPRAALRLLKHGIQVEFDRMQRDGAPTDANGKRPPDAWLVRLSFPRRLLDQNEETDLEMYDDEINPDDVTSAKDTGIDDESSMHADEQLPPGAPQDPNQPPPEEAEPPPKRPSQT